MKSDRLPRMIFLAMLVLQFEAPGAPAVFWASDPVQPGEVGMVIGEDLADNPVVELVRLPDTAPAMPPAQPLVWPNGGQSALLLQTNPQSLKFAVPATFSPGVFALRISTPTGSVTNLLNRPQVWWAQGDGGTSATPGGWIRLFGKNLAPLGTGGAPAAVYFQGPTSLALPASGDEYAARVSLPANLPPGSYTLFLHNGHGGDFAWSEPVTLSVAAPVAWPQTSFNVKGYGAIGDGSSDDTARIQAALDAAQAAGGGIVFFPRGRYKVSDMLRVPRFTVLRGERRDWVCLAWTDFTNPPTALVRGTNSFGMEDLTLYADNHQHVIQGDLGNKAGAGDVFLRRVTVRADMYRGHLTTTNVDERLRYALRFSTGGGDTVQVGGRNVEITDCDFYGSGRALYLSRVRGSRVSGNTFYNGRWGWYCLSGSDGLVFENNEVIGADLMSTGGGLNCLDGSAFSQNVYYASNHLRLMHGWDREAMTSDAGGNAYFGGVASVAGTTLTLTNTPDWSRGYTNAAVCILNGRGAGQLRRVVGYAGTTLQVDRPWDVEPDATSELSITMFQGHYMIIGNDFTDTGAMQFYGMSIECLVARNQGTRMSGFSGLGLNYYGFQPSWYCQFLDNEILEGNYYHWTSASAPAITIQGNNASPYSGPMNVGAVVRRNYLANNALIRVTGAVRDALIESNRVENTEMGVFVSRSTTGVLATGNSFTNVTFGVGDETNQRELDLAKISYFLEQTNPVAYWSFDAFSGANFPDTSGFAFTAVNSGTVTNLLNGLRGPAARFNGSNWLRVDAPAVFNAPNLSVSFWMKPETLSGRRGLVSKRWNGGQAPWIIYQSSASIGFEATDVNGGWTFNFTTAAVLSTSTWTHVAVTAEEGMGIKIYTNGTPAASKANTALRYLNGEPVIIGREAWGGDPPNGSTPGYFIGLLDELKIWTHVLSPEEVRNDFDRFPPAISISNPTNNALVPPESLTISVNASDDGGVALVEFFADGVKLGEDTTAPFSFLWTDLPSGLHTLAARATDYAGKTADSDLVNVTVLATATNLVSPSAIWKCSDSGLNLSNAWSDLAFDDRAWPSGQSPLGYGDAYGVWPATTNRHGPDANNKYITTYYRHAFVLTNSFGFASLAVQRDDGVIVYLNGTEILRSNMTNGPVDYRTLALTNVTGPTELDWYSNSFPASLLIAGTNVLAAEIHQSATNSSDIWFNLLLTANSLAQAQALLSAKLNGNSIQVQWPASSPGSLWTTTNLNLPVQWTAATNAVINSNGQATIQAPIESEQNYFQLKSP